jgi:uncharacterized protein YdaU (DUF1376 family)
MHYYKHHIGDFAKDTGNLNDHQLATYMRMLWAYYSDERPFEDDCDGIAFAVRSDDKTVSQLLRHYFHLELDGWHHKRCDKEISEYKGKADSARKSANARWSNANALRTNSERKPNARVLDANHKPITNNQDKSLKATVQPEAGLDRFDEFWSAYPNKQGKASAQKKWKKERLDLIADQILAHVDLMVNQDDGWSRGFTPMGSTYLNQSRWTDVPKSKPQGSSSAQPKLTPAESVAVNIARNNGGEIPAGYENNRNVVAALGRDLRPQVDDGVWLRHERFSGSDVGEGIKWLNGSTDR